MNITKIQTKPIGRTRKYTDGYTRIYICPEGETIWENIENRKQRPYTIYKKELLPDIIKKLKEEHEIDLTGKKISWSQYAGCSCPCSPGFVVPGHWGQNIWVTITA